MVLQAKTILFLLAILVVSFGGSFLLIKKATPLKLLDIPNNRSLHTQPTPSGGGLAILFGWLLALGMFWLFGSIDKQLLLALLLGIPIALISIIDDIRRVSPLLRLLVHFSSVIGALYILDGVRPFAEIAVSFNYQFISYPVAVIGIVWFINLYNFMDGIDGLASFEAVLISIVLFIFTGDPLLWIFISSIAGFLYWNWPRAKIFLGDVGSTQLGYVLVILGVYYHNTFDFSILNWVMISSPFWFDATYTLLRRMRNGEKLSEPHRKHLYQRLVRAGFSHLQVNLFALIINVLILLLILLYREYPILKIPVFCFVIALFFIISYIVEKLIPFRSSENEKALLDK